MEKDTIVKLVDGITFVGKGKSNHWIPMDASPAAGGSGAGTSPMELLLIGLGGCTGVDVVLMLKKRKKKLDKFTLEISSERADSHPKVYTKIHITYKLWGKDLTEKEVKRAIELSEEKFCSASIMFSKTAEITYDFQINPDE